MMVNDCVRIAVVGAILFIIGLGAFAVMDSFFSEEAGLPEAAQRSPQTKEAYLFAREHPEILEKIPCFCGCTNMGHKSNKDCYFMDSGQTAEHGSLCDGCVGITLDVKKMYLEGRDLKEIRSYIEEKYGGGGVFEPTPTPPLE